MRRDFELRKRLRRYAQSALAVLAATALAAMIVKLLPLLHVSTIFIVPVLVSAMWWGLGPALLAAALSVMMGTLFYTPRFSFHVAETADILDLAIFSIVAVVISRLAGRAREQMRRALSGEAEVRRLYALSRDISSAAEPGEIYDAVAAHLSRLLHRPVALLAEENGQPLRAVGSTAAEDIPPVVWEMASRLLHSHQYGVRPVTEMIRQDGQSYLVCALAEQNQPPALIAAVICEGEEGPSQDEVGETLAMLEQGSKSLTRLGVVQALDERRLRKRTDELRDILLNSVAHELRTPLSGVLGAATALADAPCIAGDWRLSNLARLIAEESDRLNAVIQDALDATRVRSGALVPRLEWVEISDVLNGALERSAQRLGRHRVDISFMSHPPLLRLDAPLVEQALINILENAAKYTPEQSVIGISIRHEDGHITLQIVDEGPGLSDQDTERMFDMGYRGESQNDAVLGTGMGLAVAKVFIEANSGVISAQSRGADKGTQVEIRLPVPPSRIIVLNDD